MGHGNICQTGDGYYLGFAIYEALTINDIIYNTLNHCKQLPFEQVYCILRIDGNFKL